MRLIRKWLEEFTGLVSRLSHKVGCNHNLWCPWCEQKMCRGNHGMCERLEADLRAQS
jgi:hypothetical protein